MEQSVYMTKGMLASFVVTLSPRYHLICKANIQEKN
jgi:hypothetical protein